MLAETRRVLYGLNLGNPVAAVPLEDDVQCAAAAKDFDAQHYVFKAASEQLRAPRVVRIGLIQHAMPVPATAPYAEQTQVCARWLFLLCMAQLLSNIHKKVFLPSIPNNEYTHPPSHPLLRDKHTPLDNTQPNHPHRQSVSA